MSAALFCKVRLALPTPLQPPALTGLLGVLCAARRSCLGGGASSELRAETRPLAALQPLWQRVSLSLLPLEQHR